MGKKILVINLGGVIPEIEDHYHDYYMKHPDMAPLREEYHLLIMNIGMEPKVYIAPERDREIPILKSGGISSGPSFGEHKPVSEMVVPIDKLKAIFANNPHEDVVEVFGVKIKRGVIDTIRHCTDQEFTFGFSNDKEIYITSISDIKSKETKDFSL